MEFDAEELAEIRGYLAGLIDGEGHVEFRWNEKYRQYTRVVDICNTDPAIIAHASYCLDALGISHRIGQYRAKTNAGKTLHRIFITGRENMRKLIQLPIQSAKLDKLTEIQNSYKAVSK
jgi:hypothetical protein